MLKNGGLYFIHNCSVSYPIKDKFAICVSAQDNIFYLVNSCDEKRPYRHELDFVVYIEPHNLQDISHRSYINVSKIHVLPEEDIQNSHEICVMTNDLWLRIKNKIVRCPLIQNKYKQIISGQQKFH